jgi:hypothetical protein
MSDRREQFVKDMVERVPELGGTVEAHLDNYDELLIYVLIMDVTWDVVEAYASGEPDDQLWRLALTFFEEQADRGVPENDTLIATAFLGQLPYRGSPNDGILDHIGPILAARLARMRPDTAAPRT